MCHANLINTIAVHADLAPVRDGTGKFNGFILVFDLVIRVQDKLITAGVPKDREIPTHIFKIFRIIPSQEDFVQP